MTDVDDLSAGDPFADYEGQTEPDCFDCFDRGALPGTRWCPTCHPSPRQARRTRHRMWQHRDRATRAHLPAGYLPPFFDDRRPF